MSTQFHCDDKETLVAYLYDDIDSDLRRQVHAHLRACADCADEVEGLRAVRRDLAEWQPPVAELNFAIVQKSATVLRPTRWWSSSQPAWAQVAAAVLVLATGAAIANLRVRYNSEGLTVTTGWMNLAPAATPVVERQPADDWRPALTALEADLRRELQTMRATTTAPPPPTSLRASSSATIDADALMRRVQKLVNDSEQRQQQELALRMIEFGRDVRSDLTRMNAGMTNGFRELRGRTGLVEGNQREMYNLMRRVSTQQVPE